MINLSERYTRILLKKINYNKNLKEFGGCLTVVEQLFLFGRTTFKFKHLFNEEYLLRAKKSGLSWSGWFYFDRFKDDGLYYFWRRVHKLK